MKIHPSGSSGDASVCNGLERSMGSGDAAPIELLRETLRHAAQNTSYYKRAFAGLSLDVESLDDLRRFPLLDRDTLAEHGTDLLVEGVVPEYICVTSGTTFSDTSRQPLLHYQVESEHRAWVDLHDSMAEHCINARPLMLRVTDPDRGVEIAGAFPGCFSVPMENLYHFELILSLLRREWSFPGFGQRIISLSGPLDALQLFTLLCFEHHVDPSEFALKLISSSGWQLTSRWRRLLEGYWGVQLQDVYGISEAPGMFATRCADCEHYHFSSLSLIEILHLDRNEPVCVGVGRIVVTCLLPLAYAQPLIRYDTQDIVSIARECCNDRLGFDYLGRRSKIVFLDGRDGCTPLLSPLIVTDILDSVPTVAVSENAKASRFGLQNRFGWPRYTLRHERELNGVNIVLGIELRWSSTQYPDAAQELRDSLLKSIVHAAPALAGAVARGAARFDIDLLEPGALA